ncbi:MAG: preprotein translocase subunit YajC, partial [Clostridia bacterium]|nr:preprotein translocase subunit YajC [Clostridia bacterium]
MNGAWSASFLYLAVFFAIMYFLLIRPQQRQQKKRQEMLSKLRVNDHIVTAGGIHGRITKIKENSLIVRIVDKVE